MAISDDLRFQCYVLEEPQELVLMQRAVSIELLDGGLLNYPLTSLFDNASFEDMFEYRDYFFVLWDAKQKDLIGYAELDVDSISNIAEFSASYITPTMRKNGLSKCLFDARFEKLRDLGFNGVIKSNIAQGNDRCFGRAAGYGFKRVGQSACEAFFSNGDFSAPEPGRDCAPMAVKEWSKPALDYVPN